MMPSLATMHDRPAALRVTHVISNPFVVESNLDECSTESYMTAYRFDDGSEHEGPANRGKLALRREGSVALYSFQHADDTWRAGPPETRHRTIRVYASAG
jgi:hypothetical protein